MGLYSFHGRGTLNGVIPHPGLVEMVEKSATGTKTPLQKHATVGLLTDASYVQFVNGGTPSLDLCWPTRYTHTGVELCSLDDLEGLQALITHVVSSFPANWDGTRD
jgi:putative aminopeptidase FrvX